ncbi:T9SS type A sorting domain-containing protein [Flavobacterium caeni]|uniref:Delta-60 repeat domain-containing protein/Por secretion system C-terminal sorting domain-containing protein n=1 Tax=Flavobacterium caeni TaxID=490189 RepID=A0A1G5JFY5_9FLAO|nr:T9SS type A sorting domain-containing protein [Flavobacterium caeni]SCY87293.1 delta-60 repeat domain-containing protein/Por secretion system C-terminal sorting domain-containing protein [Flavobacterium caeni]
MKKTITLFLAASAFLANAQDGTLDGSFGNNGVMEHSVFAEFVDMKVDYYNKAVALGKNENGIPILVRFNADGSLDTTFDEDGIKEIDFGNDDETPASFCIFDNGGPSLYGYLVASSKTGAIARILNDGSFAAGFGNNGIYTYHDFPAFRLAYVNYDWANYKIIVCRSDGGYFDSAGGKIYRMNTNGTPDTSFNGGNPVNFYFNAGNTIIPSSIQSDDDGNIYVSGYYPSNYQTAVAKFSTGGVRDWSFSPSSASSTLPGYLFDAMNNTSYSYGSSWSGASEQMTVRKHNIAGNSDSGFGTGGTALIEIPDAYYGNVLSLTPHDYGNGVKIIAAGRTREQSSSAMANITVARLNADGSVDTTFGTSGITSVPTGLSSYTLAVASAVDYENGKLYIMGQTGAASAGRHEGSLAVGAVTLSRLNLESILSVKEEAVKKPAAYPNPAHGTLYFSEPLNGITIYDATGRVIKSYAGTNGHVDIAGLSKGNYIVKGETEAGERFNVKFVKL